MPSALVVFMLRHAEAAATCNAVLSPRWGSLKLTSALHLVGGGDACVFVYVCLFVCACVLISVYVCLLLHMGATL